MRLLDDLDDLDLKSRIKQRQRMRWLAEFMIAGLCVFALVWLFLQL